MNQEIGLPHVSLDEEEGEILPESQASIREWRFDQEETEE